MSKYPYREAVGALLWLSLGTKPDISYSVSQVTSLMTAMAKNIGMQSKEFFGI